jgi:hypothetical protein
MKIFFEKGWYELEGETKKQHRWSGPEAFFIVEDSKDSQDKLIISLFNNNEKTNNFSIFLKKQTKTNFELFFSSNFEPKKTKNIKIPIKNLEKIQIKSDYFVPNNTDTRRLGLMLVDMLIEKDGVCSKMFLSNILNYKHDFLAKTTNYICEEELVNQKNNLECVCLLVTGNELDAGLYDHFMNQVEKTIETNDEKIIKTIDFKILIKNKDKKEYKLDFLDKFKSVDFLKLEIPDEYDFYQSGKQEIENKNYKYGPFSGPNYIFFNSFKHLLNYNTTLFLECDCFLANNWIDKLYNYVNFSGGFWISGAVYDGLNKIVLDSLLNSHINGGVCLYKTSDTCFQNLMQLCFDIMPIYVRSSNERMPYDFFIKHIIDYHFDNDLNNRIIWQFIRRQYTKNNFIINYSTKNDIKESTEKIFQKYDCAIVHKKPF